MAFTPPTGSYGDQCIERHLDDARGVVLDERLVRGDVLFGVRDLGLDAGRDVTDGAAVVPLRDGGLRVRDRVFRDVLELRGGWRVRARRRMNDVGEESRGVRREESRGVEARRDRERGAAGGEKRARARRERKSLRNGVHHACAVVWGPV